MTDPDKPPPSMLDLEFDEIKGKKKQTEKDIPKSEDKKEKKTRKAGIQLSIPNNGGWTQKDIEECTGEEFLSWAKEVYPRVTADPKRFLSTKNKVEVFKKILRYHQQFLSPEQRETKH